MPDYRVAFVVCGGACIFRTTRGQTRTQTRRLQTNRRVIGASKVSKSTLSGDPPLLFTGNCHAAQTASRRGSAYGVPSAACRCCCFGFTRRLSAPPAAADQAEALARMQPRPRLLASSARRAHPRASACASGPRLLRRPGARRRQGRGAALRERAADLALELGRRGELAVVHLWCEGGSSRTPSRERIGFEEDTHTAPRL